MEAAIATKDEQALLDFIGRNRGGLIIDPVEMRNCSSVFLKLAGNALAAGMQRAAITVYQFVPSTEAGPPEIIRLAAIALIHERNGNVRGAFNIALTADAGASEEIARQAAPGVLRILRAAPEGAASGRKQEAAAVAGLYQLSLGGGAALPGEFKGLLNAGK